jgi:predicted phage-related endonuclease
MNDHGLGLTPEQLAHRRNFIGGSDAGDIMAGDWRRLWRIKTGREEEGDLYDRLSATMDYFVLKHFTRERMDLTRLLGHATEDLNAFWYEKQTGRDVGHRRVWRVSRHPDRSFMGANLDGSSTTSHGHFC